MVTLNVEVGAKRLKLLHELVPSATTVVLLINPTNRILSETITDPVGPEFMAPAARS